LSIRQENVFRARKMDRKIIIAVTILAVVIILVAYFFVGSTNSLTKITVNLAVFKKLWERISR
jgi:uncharacterized membrane protein